MTEVPKLQNDYERAQASLDEIIILAQNGQLERNEATTRLHLINSLLTECLGWSVEEAVAEDRLDGTYADYTLGRPIRKLLVEAKREGVYFELPVGFNRQTSPIRHLFESNPAIEAAILQAARYAQDRGVPIAAVTNGHQIIAFVASRQDGTPPLDGRALVFSSLENIKEHFRTFWNNLSKAAVEAFNIVQTLGVAPAAPPPEKLSQRVVHYPGSKNRNRLQTSLQILSDLFLEDLVSAADLEQDFLRECYSASGALSQYAMVSREILRTRYSLLFERETGVSTQPARTKAGVSPQLRSDIVAASFSRRPIILLGNVGVGKSIFIKHLIGVDAKDLLERALVLYVDFGKEPAFPDRLYDYVIEQFTAQLHMRYGLDIDERDFVRGMYHGELLRFARGVHADLREIDETAYKREELTFIRDKVNNRPEHLRASLEHASRAQNRQIVVFLDNVDQRPFEFQEQVFLIAHTMAQTWPGTVFVALRPETFYRSRSEGTLAAYQPRVFTISPPRVDLVINKRLTFAKKQLGSQNIITAFGDDLLVQTESLSRYFAVLIRSFDSRHDLVEFVDNLCGGNVRVAIGFIQSFVGSGHVDTGKILDILEATGSYEVPLHEFMRAVMYGDYEYYNPEASPIVNLFDISSPDGREHFLLPSLLAYIEKAGELGREQGYVAIEDIYTYAGGLGFQPSQVQFALKRARDKKCVEFTPGVDDNALGARARLTTVGAYSFKRLPTMFAYVDAVVVDTPIVHQTWRTAIKDAHSIRERLPRAEKFRAYLDSEWRSLAGKDTAFDWPSVSAELRANTTWIGKRQDPDNWP